MTTPTQPPPIPNDSRPIHDIVVEDLRDSSIRDRFTDSLVRHLEERKAKGIATYGVPLQAYNGRSATRDLLEEVLDALIYARQGVEESIPGTETAYRQLMEVALDLLATRPELA